MAVGHGALAVQYSKLSQVRVGRCVSTRASGEHRKVQRRSALFEATACCDPTDLRVVRHLLATNSSAPALSLSRGAHCYQDAC
jgi:hypothetical protein